MHAITQTSRTRFERQAWISAAAHALWINLLVLGLFYYWFAVANRYSIFLYDHLGSTPFDETTRSRYWMAGLVAAGFVLAIYTSTQWALGRAAAWRGRARHPSDWRRVWLLCALPLAAGILWITMRLNSPTLPSGLAAACVAAAWIGVALALAPGEMAAQQPRQFIATSLYAMGVVPSLLLVRAVELTDLIGVPQAYGIAVAMPVAGALWMMLLRRVHVPTPSPVALGVVALCIAYLVLPLVHYLFFAPPAYRYITTAGNIFARTLGVQLITFLVAAGLVSWGAKSK